MVSFLLLNFFFFLTAFGYTVFASQAFDQRNYAWFPFPRVATDHFTITLLKIVPTCLCIVIAATCFDRGVHWFTLAYLGYLALMPIGDWVIFKDNDKGIAIFAFAHVLSESTVLAFLVQTGFGTAARTTMAVGLVLSTLFALRILATGKVQGSMRWVVFAYALLLAVSLGSYTGLALEMTEAPWLLRVSFLLTPWAIIGVDALYTVNEYLRPVSQLWILGFYYTAIWLLAMNMIMLSEWVLFVPAGALGPVS